MSDISRRTFWVGLTVIGGLGLAWQLLFIVVWRQNYFVWGDAYFYYESGLQLADGVGWINPYVLNELGVVEQAADHPPLYIVFLAFWSWVGLNGVMEQMALTSLFIGLPVIVIAGLAGREIRSRRLGLIAAALVAVYPGVWAWHGVLLSEPMAMLGVVTIVFVAYRYWHHPSLPMAAALGAALTFATFGRAELLLLSVVMITPMILRTQGWTWARRSGALVIAGASCVALLAPWVVFNLSRFEEPVFVSEGYQITLATSTCDETFYGEGTGYWSFNCPVQYYEEAGLTGIQVDQSERSEVLLEASLEYLGENVDRLPTVVVARWARITSVWKPLTQANNDAFQERRDPWVTMLAHGLWFPLAGAAIAGAVLMRRRGETILPLVAPLIVVFITVTITFGQSRYRASVEPVVAIMAAVAAEAAWSWFCRLRDDPEDRLPIPDTAH